MKLPLDSSNKSWKTPGNFEVSKGKILFFIVDSKIEDIVLIQLLGTQYYPKN